MNIKDLKKICATGKQFDFSFERELNLKASVLLKLKKYISPCYFAYCHYVGTPLNTGVIYYLFSGCTFNMRAGGQHWDRKLKATKLKKKHLLNLKGAHFN